MLAVSLNKAGNLLEFEKLEGVDWDTRNNEGKSLMDVAKGLGHCTYGKNMISTTELMEKRELAERLAGGFDVNTQNGEGLTALHQAMRTGKMTLVRFLLSRPDTRLDIADRTGCTPLHLACRYNCVEVILPFCQDARCTQELINLKNNEGHSALMASVYHQGQVSSLKILSEEVQGIDWNTKNNDGKSLLEIATEMNKKAISKFLERRLKKRAREDNGGAVEMPSSQKVRLEADYAEIGAKLGGELGEMFKKMAEKKSELDEVKKVHDNREIEFDAKQKDGIKAFELKQAEEKKELEIKQGEKRQEFTNNLRYEKDQFEASLTQLKQEIAEKKTQFGEYEEKVNEKKMLLDAGVGSSSKQQQSKLIPECPVCFEPMATPMHILTCKNGHQVSGVCKPKLNTCATCRSGKYISRNRGMEETVRKIMNFDD